MTVTATTATMTTTTVTTTTTRMKTAIDNSNNDNYNSDNDNSDSDNSKNDNDNNYHDDNNSDNDDHNDNDDTNSGDDDHNDNTNSDDDDRNNNDNDDSNVEDITDVDSDVREEAEEEAGDRWSENFFETNLNRFRLNNVCFYFPAQLKKKKKGERISIFQFFFISFSFQIFFSSVVLRWHLLHLFSPCSPLFPATAFIFAFLGHGLFIAVWSCWRWLGFSDDLNIGVHLLSWIAVSDFPRPKSILRSKETPVKLWVRHLLKLARAKLKSSCNSSQLAAHNYHKTKFQTCYIQSSEGLFFNVKLSSRTHSPKQDSLIT